MLLQDYEKRCACEGVRVGVGFYRRGARDAGFRGGKAQALKMLKHIIKKSVYVKRDQIVKF